MATPMSPCRIGDAVAEGRAIPLGGVDGRALFGGGPGLARPGMSNVRDRAALEATVAALALVHAEEMVEVGLLEKLLRLPSCAMVHPSGDIGGDVPNPFILGVLSDLGSSLLIVGAKTGDAGKPARIRGPPADDGLLFMPTSSNLRSLNGGGGVSGTPSGPGWDIMGENRGVGESVGSGGDVWYLYLSNCRKLRRLGRLDKWRRRQMTASKIRMRPTSTERPIVTLTPMVRPPVSSTCPSSGSDGGSRLASSEGSFIEE